MSYRSDSPSLEIDLDAIVRNYMLLRNKGKQERSASAAVVKANAYGLGIKAVAPALHGAGCRDFFVATLDEAMELHSVFVSHAMPSGRIYVFHGIRKGEKKTCLVYGIIPVLNDPGQVEEWADSGSWALHIDTGMCRLGLSPEEAGRLAGAKRNLVLVLSHLACANEPHNPRNLKQLERFKACLAGFPSVSASFANSSGIFLGEEYHFDVKRPGCALYGISPNVHLPNPMEPVAALSAPVLQYRTLTRDEEVGYGAAGHARKGATLATVELGYADGLLRVLGDKAYGIAAGMQVPVIGRVSMDMVSVDVSAVPEHMRNETLRVFFINREQPVDMLAEAAGTIGYEIFTRLGARVARNYYGGSALPK